MSRKSTKAEVELRAFEVLELLLRGMMRHEIVQYASKKWGVCSRMADNYIAKARKVLYESECENAEQKKAKRLRELDFLYSEAFRKNQFKTCLDIRKLQAELEGLLVQKHEVKGNINDPREYMTPKEVTNEVDRLLEMRRTADGG